MNVVGHVALSAPELREWREDGRGGVTTYDELLVTVGGGYMALAFWRDLLVWAVDVGPDQADREAFTRVARAVLVAATEVSGYVADVSGLGVDERRLLVHTGTTAR